jgi:flagellar biosynthesis/type III secretory pathway chaperone
MQSLLKEIHDSISLVETNRTDNNLSKIEKAKLEETLMTLTTMERTIINETNTNMLSKLSASTPALTELINDMASSTEKLDELNSKLRKIINIINFVKF